MNHPLGIDPCVDVAFLNLLGGRNERVHVNFLNAVLGPVAGVTQATVQNPVVPGDFEGPPGLRLDLLVKDQAGRTYQVEMQRQRHRGLPQRMPYGWSRVYADQVETGEDYSPLMPVVSICICETDPVPNAQNPT